MAERTALEILLDSTLDSVDAAESLVLRTASEMSFSEDDLHEIGMAVREAMVNAVVHGNRYNFNKKVRLNVSDEGDQLRILIEDQGEGFERSELPDPLAEENLMRQSGRGLLLIRAFMNEFEIRPGESGGTQVTLVKRRNTAA